MSCNLQKVCYKILNEYFGDIVARVGDALFQKGLNPLKVICTHSKLPYSKVSEALAVLVQHNLVTWEEWRPQTPGYTLLHDRILLILRFPRYVYLVREQFGEEGEMVVDVLLKEGQATASSIIITSCTKLYEAATDESAVAKGNLEQKHIVVRNHLLKLIENEFIQRCPSPQDPKVPVPVLSIKEDQLYSLPSELLDLKALQQEIQLRRAGDTKPAVTHPDAQIYWRVNYDRFHIEFRDSEIRNCVVRRVDPLAGECLGAMLKVSYTRSDPWASSMNVVTASEIRDHLKDLKYLDQYLKILEDDSGGCVQKVGDAGGGQYRLNMANAYETMTHALIDNIVQERFGSKAARIFRLIRKHRMMEQDQIGELSMIGKKEANLLSYRLLHDNFLRIHEQRKTLAPSPANKIIYLFHVDMNSLAKMPKIQAHKFKRKLLDEFKHFEDVDGVIECKFCHVKVVRMILECCYKGLYNLMVQREMRSNYNRRLLEKRTRVDTIVENLKQSGGSEEQIQEVEEMVTPSERSLVEQVLATQDKLFDAETGLDDTIFILQMFLYYQMQKE